MAMATACSRIVSATLKEFGRGGCAEPSFPQLCSPCSRIERQLVGPRQWYTLLPRSETWGARTACANSASYSAGFSSEAWAVSGLEQRKHANLRNQRSARVQVAAVREGQDNASDDKLTPVRGEQPPDGVPERWTLEQLDQQLRFLQNQESSPSQRISGDLAKRENAASGRGPLVQWPKFTTEFFVYTAIGLMLLTIFNNVMYKIFLGSPVADRTKPIPTSVPVSPRYRVTTRQEEREAREARDAELDAIAVQSREAPSPSG